MEEVGRVFRKSLLHIAHGDAETEYSVMEPSTGHAIREDDDFRVVAPVMFDPGVLVTEIEKLRLDPPGSAAHGTCDYAMGVGPPGMARNSSPGVGSMVW